MDAKVFEWQEYLLWMAHQCRRGRYCLSVLFGFKCNRSKRSFAFDQTCLEQPKYLNTPQMAPDRWAYPTIPPQSIVPQSIVFTQHIQPYNQCPLETWAEWTASTSHPLLLQIGSTTYINEWNGDADIGKLNNSNPQYGLRCTDGTLSPINTSTWYWQKTVQ